MVEGRVHTRNTLDRSGGSSADGTVSRVTSTFELSKHGLRASARYAPQMARAPPGAPSLAAQCLNVSLWAGQR